METALAEAAPVRPRGPDESTILRAKLTQLSDQLAHYKGTNTRMQVSLQHEDRPGAAYSILPSMPLWVIV